jgi:hypothetical protein
VIENFFLGGVLLSYSKDPQRVRDAVGLIPVPREIGEQIHSALAVIFGKSVIQPSVSRVVEFEDLPEAMEEKESRKTTGRVAACVRA